MGQVNGTESGDAYTVVIFRGSSAKPLRFSFPRKLVSRLLVVGAIFVLVDLLVLGHYVIRTGEVWELSSFRAEAMSAREQTGAFSGSIDDLKKRLASMKQVNQRLRVMLGIDPQKTGDTTNGRGGVDAPIPDGHTLPVTEEIPLSDAQAQLARAAEISQSALPNETRQSAGSSDITQQRSEERRVGK